MRHSSYPPALPCHYLLLLAAPVRAALTDARTLYDEVTTAAFVRAGLTDARAVYDEVTTARKLRRRISCAIDLLKTCDMASRPSKHTS